MTVRTARPGSTSGTGDHGGRGSADRGVLAEESRARGIFERKVLRSRIAILVERVWERLWPAIIFALLVYMAFAWGLVGLIPREAHLAATWGVVALGLMTLVPLARTPWPTRAQAIDRIDAQSGLQHRPAASFEDRTYLADGRAAGSGDAPVRSAGGVPSVGRHPRDGRATAQDATVQGSQAEGTGAAVWSAHRRRLARAVPALSVGSPRPRTDRYDPFALRALTVLAAVFTAVMTGDQAFTRATGLGAGAASDDVVQARIDAWLTPPVYTGRSPTLLVDGSQVLAPDSHEARRVEAPQGSVLTVQTFAGDAGQPIELLETVAPEGNPATGAIEGGTARRIDPVSAGADNADSSGGADDQVAVGLQGAGTDADAAATTPGVQEFRVILKRSATYTLRRGSQDVLTWQFAVIPDEAPEIAFKGDVRVSPRSALLFDFTASDDYGVVGATADVTIATGDGLPDLAPDAEPIIRDAAPSFGLRLAQPGAKTAEGKAFKDLTAHPYAGLPIRLRLTARDEAGQEGHSAPVQMKAPERSFRKPLAKALVEQRRLLITDPAKKARVELALGGLMIGAERFIDDTTVLLGLQSTLRRLAIANLPETARAWSSELADPLKERRVAYFQTIRSVIDQLWSLALYVEDGDLSDAERALRQAQERLKDAIENGASEEEISRLMAALREAMNRFLRELAERQQPGDQQQNAMAPNQQLSSQDLDEMLREIERLMQTGRMAEAQQLLSQLQDMLERLQSGRMARGQQGQQGNQAMQQLEQFGELIQGQQNLMDDTFQSRGGAQQGQQGQGQRGQQQGRQGQGQRGQGQRGQGQEGQDGQGQRGRGQNGQGQFGEGQPGQGQFGQGQPQQGQQGQGRPQPGQRGGQQPGQSATPGSLAQRQQGLRGQLQGLLDELQRNGQAGQASGAQDELDGAARAMERAREALERGAMGEATDEQSLALDQLRRGAQQFAQEIFEQMQQGQGTASAPNRDPLGRRQAGQQEGANGGNPNTSDTRVPDAIDVQRARTILQELRRRLSDPSRPKMELDYLDRLLERF